MHFIDSHCHIDFEAFDSDRSSLLDHCLQLGIKQIIIPAVTRSRWQKLNTLCQQSAMLFPTLGLHPLFLDDHRAEDLVELEKLIPTVKPVAIGEIGLDFYIANPDKPQQISLLEQQLELAKQFTLPVILHVRKAHDQVYALLRRHDIHHGVVHAFSGSLQQAENYIKQGLMLGAGGMLSYQKAKRIKSVYRHVPLENLILETDAPDMPLQGYREQRNSPEFIPSIANFLADLRSDTVENIAQHTTKNARYLFNIG